MRPIPSVLGCLRLLRLKTSKRFSRRLRASQVKSVEKSQSPTIFPRRRASCRRSIDKEGWTKKCWRTLRAGGNTKTWRPAWHCSAQLPSKRSMARWSTAVRKGSSLLAKPSAWAGRQLLWFWMCGFLHRQNTSLTKQRNHMKPCHSRSLKERCGSCWCRERQKRPALLVRLRSF